MKIILLILILTSSVFANKLYIPSEFRMERIEVTPTNQSEYEINIDLQAPPFNNSSCKVELQVPSSMRGKRLVSITLEDNAFASSVDIPLAFVVTKKKATVTFSQHNIILCYCDIIVYYRNQGDRHRGIMFRMNLLSYLEEHHRLQVIDQEMQEKLNLTIGQSLDLLKESQNQKLEPTRKTPVE